MGLIGRDFRGFAPISMKLDSRLPWRQGVDWLGRIRILSSVAGTSAAAHPCLAFAFRSGEGVVCDVVWTADCGCGS